MKKQRLLVWTAANALGLGVSFVAMLQMTMLIEYGLEFERHWEFVPPGDGVRAYAARLVASLLGGVILGAAQALVLRSRSVRVAPWIFATVAGFSLLVAVEWSLEGVGFALSWPMEGFLSGFPVAGVAALISGGALFAAISPDVEAAEFANPGRLTRTSIP